MSKFKIGDKVKRTHSSSTLFPAGSVGAVTSVCEETGWISVDNIGTPSDGHPFYPEYFELVEEAGEIKMTGGSTPNQYRISINLPLTEDRTQFVDVDLEAMDVIDALDLSGNLKDVQKALFRMGKKDNTSEAYDFNKCIFFLLREMKKRGIISHEKFWEATKAIDEVLSKP